MKLLRKTQRQFWLFALPVFLLAGLGMYLVLLYTVNDFSDEALGQTRVEIEHYVNTHAALPDFFQTSNHFVDSWPVSGDTQPGRCFDTLIFNPVEKESEPYRRLEFSLEINGQTQCVAISQSRMESEELAFSLAGLLILLFLILFLVLAWVNRRVSRQVWSPFFGMLEQLSNFRLADQTPLQWPEVRVDEFSELQSCLRELTVKARSEFHAIRQFTENVSHELQTPLAVIQAKLDELLQQEQLGKNQAQQLHGIAQQSRRMSRLVQALLLLAKIENDQFAERLEVDLQALVGKKLSDLDDLIASKKIAVELDLNSMTVFMHPDLAEILIANLLRNAVAHSPNGGVLKISTSGAAFDISNTCEVPPMPVEELIGRFGRAKPQGSGLGLGLPIVREICGQSNLNCEVSYANGIWKVIVSKNG